MGAVCSGSTLFASILNSSVMLGNYLQQMTSADDIFRSIIFLGALRVNREYSFFSWILYKNHDSFTQFRSDCSLLFLIQLICNPKFQIIYVTLFLLKWPYTSLNENLNTFILYIYTIHVNALLWISVSLTHLDDADNAKQAYEQALTIDA